MEDEDLGNNRNNRLNRNWKRTYPCQSRNLPQQTNRQQWRNQPRGEPQQQNHQTRNHQGLLQQQNHQTRNQGLPQQQNQPLTNHPRNRPPWRNRDESTTGNQQGFRTSNNHNRGTQRNEAHGSNQTQEDYKGNRRRQNTKLGFKVLSDISVLDPLDIIGTVNQKSESFFNLLESPFDDNPDMHVLIVKILSKAGLSSWDHLKMRFLQNVCNSKYLLHLKSYLLDLPYNNENQMRKNSLYWKGPNEFWENLTFFCEAIFDVAPSLTLQKCRSLIDGSAKVCLEGLKLRHGFVLSSEIGTRLDELRERLTDFEKKTEEEEKVRQHPGMSVDETPPEDFRQLSLIPGRDELFEQRPFVRANVVRGRYRDIDHYLDVQFRLLREDCFGPLREGLNQYINNYNQQKYDNIRVFKNVKFIGPYTSQSSTGFVVQLDEKTMKRFKKVNWAYNKRFIFGSLLMFSSDNCNTLITATVLDRDIKYLSHGLIPVSVQLASGDISFHESYAMFESEVYFEPYSLVLKALVDPTFPAHLAMSKYIIDVDPEPQEPGYLTENTVYAVKNKFQDETSESRLLFNVLQSNTWPSHGQLNLNESQFEAYQLALTHEFAIIQGPPGTGKTFLGVKVAQTLLENLKLLDSPTKCLMLVICYTNHALDQFLEHILNNVTPSIVRIGGQSRNPAMESISLTNLRKASTKQYMQAQKLFSSERRNLKKNMGELLSAQKQIESLRSGILTYNSLCKLVPEVNTIFTGIRRRDGDDVVFSWLMQNVNFQVNEDDIQELLKEDNSVIQEDLSNDDPNERNAYVLDDHENDLNEIDINGMEIKTSFMIFDAEEKIKKLVTHYNGTLNRRKKHNIEIEIRNLFFTKSVFQEMRNMYRTRGPLHLKQNQTLSSVPNADRWAIYFTWAEAAINKIHQHIAPLQEQLQEANNAYEEARMNLDINLIRDVKVVGMTTSVAARLRKLLRALAPPIVIVEEAAEVLEQHIITALTKNTQHLILIGDHQQLRPSASYMKLARHYNIEVSLFERMILNNMHSRQLRVQHRMRPEISALISPHIYPDLNNHESVKLFPNVRGITANVFFFTHNHLENKVEDGASRCNHMEADMTLCLANYLMQQDYKPEDVTILAAYSGQMFYMKKERGKYAFLDKIKITVVDNYQGEESKIILLSLVRNNKENKIGFLGTENRICVALSRAKEGFYIFGNIDILKTNSMLWTNIATTLDKNKSLGTFITLKCENHPDQITMISSAKDFEKCPEGGCLLMCKHKLPSCGHSCPRICHGYDRNHEEVKCQFKCERIICDLGHVCPDKCAVECKPCKVAVTKVLPCGHEMRLPCHLEPNDPSVRCRTEVTVTLAHCLHEVKKPCHVDRKKFACPVPCMARLERCGHTCSRNCHVNDDPDHERFACMKPCAKAKKGCTADLPVDRGQHQCTKLCHETCDECTVQVTKKRSNCKHSEKVACCKSVDDTPCRNKCAKVLPCDHFCKKICCEPCGDCNQMVKKFIPGCDHTIHVECKVEAKRKMCRQSCERQLKCGHTCTLRCDQPCSEDACRVLTTWRFGGETFPAPCGHTVLLPCNVIKSVTLNLTRKLFKEILLANCSAPCDALLKCSHPCAGSCGGCRQGRLHAPCAQPCHTDNICAHPCEEPCNQLCPPCNKKCEVKCPHSKCSRVCGAPCIVCQEDCARECIHGRCTRRCGEPCSRPPCDERCPRRLPCGHPCRGLCGEPCPPVCNVCRPDTFPKDFLGYDFDDDAKFIKLQDCSHILEVEDADNLMNGDRETISIRACPFCRKPIINTYRYKDRVNEMYETEINPIKEKVYGTIEQVEKRQIELKTKLTDYFLRHHKIIKENSHLSQAFYKIEAVLETKKRISLLQLEMHFMYVKLMDMIREKIENYNQVTRKELSGTFLKQVEITCDVLMSNYMKISEQQQEDLYNEIRRMGSIIQLERIFETSSYKNAKDVPKVKAAAVFAKETVLSWQIYKEDVVIDALAKLQKELKVTGIVTKEERDMVVKAMGFKQGHWFKCPNGHVYCIDDCGGAMEISKCNECGARIGGERHTLLSDNSLARDMDGAAFAAWSEQYNNMANFRFD